MVRSKMVKTYEEIPLDLLVILAWIIMTFIFVVTPILDNSFIRTILGIPMVIFVPGYLLIAALFPNKVDIDTVERIALSFVFSIVVVSLLGLLLDITFGIRLIPILVALCIYSIVFMVITIYTRRNSSEDKRLSIGFNKIYEIINSELKPTAKIDFILAAIFIFSVILAIVMVYHIATIPKVGERFTEFYIVNGTSKTAYNYNIKSSSYANITVGVINREYDRVNYTVQIISDKNMLADKKLSLYHDGIWETNITLPLQENNGTKVEFLLFKENNFTSPYRELHLWTNITI
jgi:uncharacterized membrane protein